MYCFNILGEDMASNLILLISHVRLYLTQYNDPTQRGSPSCLNNGIRAQFDLVREHEKFMLLDQGRGKSQTSHSRKR